MTREMPYEEVNNLTVLVLPILLSFLCSFSQNEINKDKQAFYVKSFAHRHRHYPSVAEACSKVIEATRGIDGNKLRVFLTFEYYPLGKICSVPKDATAFRRENASAGMVLVFWDYDENEREVETAKAREITHELVDIVINGQGDITESESAGYANYCMMIHFLSVVSHVD